MSILCPDGAAPLAPDATACGSCHLPLTGPAAARLWDIDQLLTSLRGERQGLLTTLRSTRDADPPAAPGVGERPTPTSGFKAWSPQRL